MLFTTYLARYELAKRLAKLKADERFLLNDLETVRKRIKETEINLHQVIELTEGKPVA